MSAKRWFRRKGGILNANMKERRMMIEDALGLKIYQYKRQESERKLEKTRENISQVDSLRKEIAPHLKFLRKQVEKIEKFKEEGSTTKWFSSEFILNKDLAFTKEKMKQIWNHFKI